ncbi:uncharacterized protein [Bemisia tabaci]
MLEYYESATHLVLSDNHLIDSRGWQACSRMIKRMRCLEILEARSVSLNDQLMPLLTRSLRVGSQLQVLKLENCHLTGRPFLILVSALKLNTNLKELFLGENYLDATDAAQIGSLLKCNNTLQFLDISNNIILDAGLGHIAEGISEQTGPGLNMLVVWNNHLTYGAAKFISLILARSSSLEMLNVGQNILTSDVIYTIKEGLQQNHMLLKFGLQSTNLTCEGAIALAEVIADNCTLQRIDLRDNNFQVAGLIALSLSMKENLTITQLDLDDTPQNYASVSVLSDYKNLVEEIRGYCLRNKENERRFHSNEELILEENVSDWEKSEPDDFSRLKLSNIDSRKISLTCETLMRHSVIVQKLEPSKGLTIEPTKLSGKLRSPLPSPVPSPVTSPSPTRSRFHVSKVSEMSDSFTSTDSNTSSSLSPSSMFSNSRFKVTVVEPEKSTVVISVPSKKNTTVGFECAPPSPTTRRLNKENSSESRISFPFKLNKPIDSLDIVASKIMKQPAVDLAAPPRARKISWIAPSSMFSFSQMQASIDDINKPTSSLDRLIDLFKSPFSQFQNKPQSAVTDATSDERNQAPPVGPFSSVENNNRSELQGIQTYLVPPETNNKTIPLSSERNTEETPYTPMVSSPLRNELLFPEEDEKIIVTISESASLCGRNTCMIGLSDESHPVNADSSVDLSPDHTSSELKDSRSASAFNSSNDNCSLTSHEVSLTGKGCIDSTSLHGKSAFEVDFSASKTCEDNSTDAQNKAVDFSSATDLSEVLKCQKNMKSSNKEEDSSDYQTSNNRLLIECEVKFDTSCKGTEFSSYNKTFSGSLKGCESTNLQDRNDFTSDATYYEDNFVLRNSEGSSELLQINEFSEETTDCNRLYLPCKLATWPQGLGLHLLGQTSCQIDQKYRCNSAPCLVEAATVVLFQRQLPSDLSVKIQKLSPTKCDDSLDPSTNLQMAS